jgi:hypothetical protein
MGSEAIFNRRGETVEITDPDGRRVLVSQVAKTTEPSSAVSWDQINASDFERLLVRLLEQSETYQRVDRHVDSGYLDVGYDVVAYLRDDKNVDATSGRLVVFQVKHSPDQLVTLAEIETLVKSKLRRPGGEPVARLVIATTGSLTRAAVKWVEKYNQDRHSMSLGIWSSNDLEALLRKKPEILAEFGLVD